MIRISSALTPDERQIANARQRAMELAQRLQHTPIDRALYGELQQFLDVEAFVACDAMEKLRTLPLGVQRRRLEDLLGVTSEAS